VDNEVQKLPLISKKEIAQMIWDRILLKID
jgi:hypothetical protein